MRMRACFVLVFSYTKRAVSMEFCIGDIGDAKHSGFHWTDDRIACVCWRRLVILMKRLITIWTPHLQSVVMTKNPPAAPRLHSFLF